MLAATGKVNRSILLAYGLQLRSSMQVNANLAYRSLKTKQLM